MGKRKHLTAGRMRRPVGLEKKDWRAGQGVQGIRVKEVMQRGQQVMQSSGGWSEGLSFHSETWGQPLQDFSRGATSSDLHFKGLLFWLCW